PRRAPDREQKRFRESREFVKYEEQEQIEAENHPAYAANQRQIEGEVFFRAMLDVPRKQHPRHGGASREQHKRDADAVGGDEILRAQGWNPRELLDLQQTRARIEFEKAQHRTSEARERREQRQATHQRELARRQEHHQHRSRERDVDGPVEHVSSRVGPRSSQPWRWS